MAFLSNAFSPAEHVSACAPVARRPSRFARFVGRLAAGMIAARQRQADRAIARYLAHTGGRLTDSVEREIEHRFFGEPKL